MSASLPESAPWKVEQGLGSALQSWSDAPWKIFEAETAGAVAETRPWPAAVHSHVVQTFTRLGFGDLFTHQAEAIEHVLQGKHVVVATPTASGKSLCYNVPLAQCVTQDSGARALYLFPTKALARDQEKSIHHLISALGVDAPAITFDGDTPGDARQVAKERCRVILSNPDMLHSGILPHHTSWARFFAGLKLVVIDELHTYRGVFGAHLANLLRRLRRIAKFYGSEPRFVFTSATIGNPEAHASLMLGEPVHAVLKSGAPKGQSTLILANPPLINPTLGVRGSCPKLAVSITADLIERGVKTILFGQSRNQVEMMLKYLRDRLGTRRIPERVVQAYRGGYLPGTRRKIETDLRDGKLLGVVSTNALELGIDIGALDAVVCAGFPGSFASLWQRMGRAGRRNKASVGVLVSNSSAMDQFIAQNPELLTSSTAEEARIDPNNIEILIQHLKCASFELPLSSGDQFGNVLANEIEGALDYLATQGVLHPSSNEHGGQSYFWANEGYPASHVSLRSGSWDNFVIVDLDGDKVLAELDWRATHTMLHEQAIYQHDAGQYQVERLDFENHKAYVRKVEPDYYTTAMTYQRVSVTHTDTSAPLTRDPASPLGYFGEVSIVEKVVGYKKIKYHTHENVGFGDVRLPEMQKHTTAYRLTFEEGPLRAHLNAINPEPAWPIVLDAIRGVLHCLHLASAVRLMCDQRDLGSVLGTPEGETEGTIISPTIFLYDQVPGGTGLSSRIFELQEALFTQVQDTLTTCSCSIGCPACIGLGGLSSSQQSAVNGVNIKTLAANLTRWVLAPSEHDVRGGVSA